MAYSSTTPHERTPSRPTDQSAGVYAVKKVLNRAAIRALQSAPQVIVNNEPGKVIVVHKAVIHTTKATAYGGAAAAGATYQLTLEGEPATGVVPIDMTATGAVAAFMPTTGDDASGGFTQAAASAADLINKDLILDEVAGSVDLTGGHADDTMTCTVWFSYADLP